MSATVKFDSPLGRATLIRRYKRFLADVRMEDGRVMTIHCPNTGSMKNCGCAGDEVWYSTSSNHKRKYAHTWELVRNGRGHYIGINTSRANSLVRAAIEAGVIAELQGYDRLRAEVDYGRENSRADFVLSGHASRADCYLEVKSVTLLEEPASAGIGYFPDAVSTRGTRHLRELADMAAKGERAVLLFCVQHSGIQRVRPAAHIDDDYAGTLNEVAGAGVEILAYKTRMSTGGLRIERRLPVDLDGD